MEGAKTARRRRSLRRTAVLVLSAYLVGRLPNGSDRETIMLRITFAAVAALATLGASVQAQDASGPSDSARYTFHRVQDAFLRLDLQTGRVSQCGWAAIGWYCRVVPDERAALESEIARLQTSNIALKKELVERGLPLPDGIKPDQQVSGGNLELKLPNDVGVGRVTGLVEKVWRRMVDMMVNLQRDMVRKS